MRAPLCHYYAVEIGHGHLALDGRSMLRLHFTRKDAIEFKKELCRECQIKGRVVKVRVTYTWSSPTPCRAHSRRSSRPR